MRRDYAYCQSKDIFILNGGEVSYKNLKNVSSNLKMYFRTYQIYL